MDSCQFFFVLERCKRNESFTRNHHEEEKTISRSIIRRTNGTKIRRSNYSFQIFLETERCPENQFPVNVKGCDYDLMSEMEDTEKYKRK